MQPALRMEQFPNVTGLQGYESGGLGGPSGFFLDTMSTFNWPQCFPVGSFQSSVSGCFPELQGL